MKAIWKKYRWAFMPMIVACATVLPMLFGLVSETFSKSTKISVLTGGFVVELVCTAWFLIGLNQFFQTHRDK